MGNTESQPTMVSEHVAANLPKRTQQRLSRPPSANNTRVSPVKKAGPEPGFGFFEVAAIAQAPSPRKKRPAATTKKRRDSNTTSTTVSSNRSGQTEKTAISNQTAKTVLVSQHDLQPLQLVFSTFNGRQYLANTGFHFHVACDDEEAERLVILHFLLKYVLKSNVLAPHIDVMLTKQTNPQVLDLACGCGTWVLEMAADYPSADIHGMDILGNFPTSTKPSNAYFYQHNYLASLPFPDNSLDYVHVRQLLGSISAPQIQRLFSEIARILKPSGTVEVVDVDYRVQHPGPLTQALINEQLYSAFQQRQIDWQRCPQLPTMLMTSSTKNGFVDIHQEETTIPLGWNGQVGQVHGQCFESFLKSIRPALRESVQCSPTWEPQTMEAHMGLTIPMVNKIVRECAKYQSHLNWYVCYAQKSSLPAQSPNSRDSAKAPSMTPSIVSSLDLLAPGKSKNMLPPSFKETKTVPPPNWETIDDFIDGYID
ncbi:S-adenosyl-L-methionine-dependent methyltransferase [Hesseltinella vesiculosa]|uniref:S-adenosyl-L-methionine-dependent methyltransferase n=1 Tax=Hesseltinella vesiculosa TaxID=101127 RepID=A0A1X2GPB3_9FUNG|nr:S-adenosyl-L-methionine-dependent methyltransferase [Hesseltinella vesiculosa]